MLDVLHIDVACQKYLKESNSSVGVSGVSLSSLDLVLGELSSIKYLVL